MMSTTLWVKKTESISDELNRVHDRIVQRAFEIFDGNGHNSGGDLDNWLAAEQELIWKPPVELTEKDNEFSVCIAVPGVDPREIQVEVTQDHLLVSAESRHEHVQEAGGVHLCEFESGSLFRSIQFPKAINPDMVKADCKNGMLHVSAPVAAEAQARKLELKAS